MLNKSLYFKIILFLFCLISAKYAIYSQILPPSYNPLPPEKIKNYDDDLKSIKDKLKNEREKKSTLEDNIQKIRQTNSADTSIAINLKNEASNYSIKSAKFLEFVKIDSLFIIELKNKKNQFLQDSIERIYKLDSTKSAILNFNNAKNYYLAKIAMDSGRTALSIPDSLQTKDFFKDYFNTINNSANFTKKDTLGVTIFRADSNRRTDFANTIELVFLKNQKICEAIGEKDSLAAVNNGKIVRYFDKQIDSLNTSIKCNFLESEKQKKLSEQYSAWALQINQGYKQRDTALANIQKEKKEIEANISKLEDDEKEKSELSRGYNGIVSRLFFPLEDRDDAIRFYGEPDVLDHITLNLETKSINIEGFNDCAGPIRFGGSIYTKLSPNGAYSAKDNLKDFYTSGGDLVFFSEYPFMYHRNSFYSVTIQSLLKVGASNIFGRPKYNIDPGAEIYGKISPFNFFSLFGFFREGLAIGFNGFARDVGYSAKNKPFAYSQVVAGVELWKFKISVSGEPIGYKKIQVPVKFTSLVIQSPLPK